MAFSFRIMNNLALGIRFGLTRECSFVSGTNGVGQLAHLVFQFCKGLGVTIQNLSSVLLELSSILRQLGRGQRHEFHGLFQGIYPLGQWTRVEFGVLETEWGIGLRLNGLKLMGLGWATVSWTLGPRKVQIIPPTWIICVRVWVIPLTIIKTSVLIKRIHLLNRLGLTESCWVNPFI